MHVSKLWKYALLLTRKQDCITCLIVHALSLKWTHLVTSLHNLLSAYSAKLEITPVYLAVAWCVWDHGTPWNSWAVRSHWWHPPTRVTLHSTRRPIYWGPSGVHVLWAYSTFSTLRIVLGLPCLLTGRPKLVCLSVCLSTCISSSYEVTVCLSVTTYPYVWCPHDLVLNVCGCVCAPVYPGVRLSVCVHLAVGAARSLGIWQPVSCLRAA